MIMNFGKLEKVRSGWMTYPIAFLFDDCRIDRIQLIHALINKGVGTQSDFVGTTQYKKKYQSIILPTPKGKKPSEEQISFLNFVFDNQISLEKNCKSVLKNLREKSKPLLPIDFAPQNELHGQDHGNEKAIRSQLTGKIEIENCIELMWIIIPFELNEGIRLYFECDWGDYASGGCSIALQFHDFNNIQECEFEVEKYGL